MKTCAHTRMQCHTLSTFPNSDPLSNYKSGIGLSELVWVGLILIINGFLSLKRERKRLVPSIWFEIIMVWNECFVCPPTNT